MAKEKETQVTPVTKVYKMKEVPFVGDTLPKFRAAAVQTAPVFLNREATIDKVGVKVKEAKANGADIVVFSESFVPTFPYWCLFLPPVDMGPFNQRLYENAIAVPSAPFYRLANIARENKVYLCIGITEKDNTTMGTMWNSSLLFDREGNLIGHHRKIMPTWGEKLGWAAGDGSSLTVHDTELGKIGVNICGENGNQLGLYSMGAQGEQVHIALYPATWPTNRKNGTYYDCLRVRTCSHSFASKVFSICCSACLDEDAIQQLSCGDEETANWLRNNSYATTMITDCYGHEISETFKDNAEGLAYADIDVSKEINAKWIHDYYGAYQRFDIFQLQLNKAKQAPIHIVNEGAEEYIPYEEIDFE